MPIAVSCAACKARLKAPEAAQGRAIRCPKCSAPVKVPRAQPAAEPEEKVSAAPPAKKAARPVERAPARNGERNIEKKAAKSNLPILLIAGGAGAVLLLGAGVVILCVVLFARRAPDVAAGPKDGPAPTAGGTENDASLPAGELGKLIDKARKDHPLNRGNTLFHINRITPVDSARKQVVDVCCLALEHPDESGHAPAARALLRWMTPESADVPRLLKVIDGSSVSASLAAIQGSRRIGDARIAEAAAKRFKAHRFLVGRSLGQMGPVAEPFILPHVKDGDPEVVRDALQVLRRIGTPKSEADVQAVISHKDANLAMRARLTLQAIRRRAANGGKDPVNPEYRARPLPPDRPVKDELDKHLAIIRGLEVNDAGKSLMRLAALPQDEERRFEVVHWVAECAEGTDGSVGDIAADTLWRWATPETFPVARAMHLSDCELPQTRRATQLLLGKYRGNKDAAEQLGEHFPFDALQAGIALVRIGPAGEPRLLEQLKRKQAPEVTRRIYWALRQIGTEATIKQVAPVIDGPDDRLAMFARTTSTAIRRRLDNGGTDPVNPEYKARPIVARPVVDNLDKALAAIRGNNNAVQLKGLELLAGIRPGIAVDEERRYEVVQLLADCLDRTEFGLAWKAAEALHRWVTPETMPLSRLMHATFLEGFQINQPLLLALGKYRNHREAVELLAEWLPFTPRQATLALMEIGRPAQPFVMPLLKDKRRGVPHFAMRALKKFGDKDALAPLREVATGKHRDHPPWARLAVAMIERREANGGKDPVNPEYRPSTLPRDRPAKDDLDRDLRLIRVPNQRVQLDALGRIAKAPFDPERGAVVAEALVELAGGHEALVDSAAAGAFAVWVRPETVPVAEVLRLVDVDNFSVRDTALRTLGRYRASKEAGECLAEMLPIHLGPVIDGLKAMGPAAEEFVLPLTKHRDRRIQGAAKKALDAIRKQ